jgi:hypothetical protein
MNGEQTMDFGGGFATGMGAGMGSGIAVGIASGRKQALSQVRDHLEQNGIVLQDRYGTPIKVDDLIDSINSSCIGCCAGNRRALIVASLVLAVGVAVAVSVWFLAYR